LDRHPPRSPWKVLFAILYDLPLLFEVHALGKHEADSGQYLTTDEDVEECCATLFRSQLFIRNSERVRYELISVANEVRPPSFGVDVD
jgi:hypothetical protein